MKKILFTILFCLLTSIGFVGCDVDNNTNLILPPVACWYWQPYQMNSNGQYGIGGYVAGAPTTRAYVIQSYDVIDNYDSFSLFMWTKDSVLNNAMFNGILNPQQGTWGYEGNQHFFDNNQPRYSFLGILPKGDYTIKADSTIDVSLEDFVTEGVEINAQKYNKEFIVAKQTVEKDNYAQGATLNFEHQNSIVRIKFETNTGNNLEILDFTPYTPGTAGTPEIPAWDETVDVTTYQMTATTVPTLGPLVTSIEISDEDMAYVNSKYTASKGFSNYSTGNVIDGNLDENMWDYLVDKYPILNTTNIENWNTYASNTNMRLVYIDKTGQKSVANDSYRGVWVNVQNVNWGAGVTTQTIVHHDAVPAVPGTPSTGKEGIVVLPATSEQQNGKDAVLATFPETVTANVGLNGVTYNVNTEEQEIIFTKAGVVSSAGVYSPTNWYTFPIVHANNFGFTIKFSYTLNGETRYDARVFVPTSKCNWQPGKWYDYVIKVNTTKHGKTDPDDADEDDPKVDEEFPINVNSSVDEYTEGEVHEFTI